MSEATARALGAGDGDAVVIAGKQCRIRPLAAKELAEVERMCLKAFKREFLSTYADNQDLLPESVRTSLLMQKMEEVARWDIKNLPTHTAVDPKRITVTDELKARVQTLFAIPAESMGDVKRITRLAAAAMDKGMISNTDYQTLTGEAPPKVNIPYSNWWITGCFEGMVALVWTCFADSGVTKDEVARELGQNEAMLVQLSRAIEHLSAPKPHFGSGSPG